MARPPRAGSGFVTATPATGRAATSSVPAADVARGPPPVRYQTRISAQLRDRGQRAGAVGRRVGLAGRRPEVDGGGEGDRAPRPGRPRRRGRPGAWPAKLDTGSQIRNVRPSHSRAGAPSSQRRRGSASTPTRTSTARGCGSSAAGATVNDLPAGPLPAPSSSPSTRSQWWADDGRRRLAGRRGSPAAVGDEHRGVLAPARRGDPGAGGHRDGAAVAVGAPRRSSRIALAATGGWRCTPSRLRNATYAFPAAG